jgi:hypothetical protein
LLLLFLLALLLVFLGRFLVLLLVAVAVELLLLLLLVVAVALLLAAGGGDGFFSSISGALSRSSVGASPFELSRAVAVSDDALSSSRPSSLISATDSETAGVSAVAASASVGDREAVFSSPTATSCALGEVVGTRDDESSPVIMDSSFRSSSIFILADGCNATDKRMNE